MLREIGLGRELKLVFGVDAAEAELGEWVAIVMGVPGESNSRVLSAESRRTAVVVSCICGRPPSVPISLICFAL